MMADLYLPNLLETGAQGYALGKERRRQKVMGANMQGAMGGDAQSLSNIYQVDPSAGLKVEDVLRGRQDDAKKEAMGKLQNVARLYATAPPQIKGQLYGQIRQLTESTGLVPTGAMPASLDTPEDQQGFEQFIASIAGSSSGAVQSTYIDDQGNRVAVMRDGSQKILGGAAPNMQLIEGQGGYFGVNRNSATPNAIPVNIGGAPQPAGPFKGADGATVNIDPSLPPEIQASIRENEGQWASSPAVDLGTVNRPTGQLRPADKPMSEGERQRLQMEQERLRIEQAKFDASQKANAVTGKPPTEDERKAAGWHKQATFALDNMMQALQEDPTASTPGLIEQYVPGQEIKNRSMSPARQRYAQAASSFAEAALRAATGAGINEFEAKQKIAEVTPQRGDRPEVVQQKLAAAKMYVEALQTRAGRALQQPSITPAPSAPRQAPRPKPKPAATNDPLGIL